MGQNQTLNLKEFDSCLRIISHRTLIWKYFHDVGFVILYPRAIIMLYVSGDDHAIIRLADTVFLIVTYISLGHQSLQDLKDRENSERYNLSLSPLNNSLLVTEPIIIFFAAACMFLSITRLLDKQYTMQFQVSMHIYTSEL